MTTPFAHSRSDVDTVRSELAASNPGSTPSSDFALQCVGLSKRYGTLDVVTGLDLAAHKGEVVALLGPSGCGKTTTLRLIAGFEEPDAGTIAVGGRVVAEVTAGRVRCDPPEARRVGMVFQDYALFPHLRVGENVAFGLPRLGRGERETRVAAALRMVGLAGLAERAPHQLSGGQQQRVALARALAPHPDVVLLDEPFSNLDPELRADVRAEVRQILAAAGTTALLVTHDREEALSLADRVAVMGNGRIVQMAAPEELYHRPATRWVAGFVGEAEFIPGEAHGRRVTTDLGELPTHGATSGPVDVMFRPEQLRLVPVHGLVADPATSGVSPPNATILAREFYGHDQLMTVRLDVGRDLRARLGPYGGIRPGDRVHVSVRGAVLTFPREG